MRSLFYITMLLFTICSCGNPRSRMQGPPVRIIVTVDVETYERFPIASGVEIDVSGVGPSLLKACPQVGTNRCNGSFRAPNGYYVGDTVNIRVSKALCALNCTVLESPMAVEFGTFQADQVTNAGRATVIVTIAPL